MKKFLSVVFLGLSFVAFNVVALDKTSNSKLPEQCQKLFKGTEKLVSEAKKQPGTHTQINQIQNKLNQSKKQILEMELATQIKSCNQGLAKLSNLQKVDKELN